MWYGSTNGSAASTSFDAFFKSVGETTANSATVNAFSYAISKIGSMPAPFVKYCSTVWGKEFVDDEDWD